MHPTNVPAKLEVRSLRVPELIGRRAYPKICVVPGYARGRGWYRSKDR